MLKKTLFRLKDGTPVFDGDILYHPDRRNVGWYCIAHWEAAHSVNYYQLKTIYERIKMEIKNGKQLKALREKLGLRQEDVAILTKTGRTNVTLQEAAQGFRSATQFRYEAIFKQHIINNNLHQCPKCHTPASEMTGVKRCDPKNKDIQQTEAKCVCGKLFWTYL